MRLCVYSNSAHLCRSLYPTGSPNIRDESSTQRLAGVLGRFEDPTFPLVALHQEVTAATLYCAGADLSDVDVSLDSVTSRQLGLPFRLGGAGLRDPATIRKAAYLSANRSAAQYAASDGTLWVCHTRPDTDMRSAAGGRKPPLAAAPCSSAAVLHPFFISGCHRRGAQLSARQRCAVQAPVSCRQDQPRISPHDFQPSQGGAHSRQVCRRSRRSAVNALHLRSAFDERRPRLRSLQPQGPHTSHQ